MSSVITISQPPIVPGDKIHPDAPTAMTFASVDPDLDPDELDIDVSESSEPEVLDSSTTSTIVGSGEDIKKVQGSAPASRGTRDEAEAEKRAHEAARMESLAKLQRGAAGNAATGSAETPRGSDKGRGKGIVKLSWKRGNAQVSARHQQTTSIPDAVIVLKEEKVRLFATQSRPSYPHLIGTSGKHLSRLSPIRLPWVRLSPSQKSDSDGTVLTFRAAWSARSPGTTWKVS